MAENHRSSKKASWGVGPVFPRFKGQAIADDFLQRIIEAGHVSISEWNLQTWRWIVVRNEGAKKYLEAATYLQAPLGSAPVVLICIADTLAWKSAPQYLQEMVASRKITEDESREALRRLRDYYASSPEAAERTALANAFAAVQRTLLGAEECGLSAYWVTEFDEGKIKTHFHIPDQFLVAALIPLGYHEETLAPPVPKLLGRSPAYQEKFGEIHGPTS